MSPGSGERVVSTRGVGVARPGVESSSVGDRWSTGRIEAFSDGVIAIAITLLVLEIGVPEADFENLWRGILEQWPSYLAYATSFLTIGGIWLAHHGIFRRLAFADARIMRLNLLLLMAVAFLPFPTKLMAEAIRDPEAEQAAVIFYGLNLLVISALVWALWAWAARERTLLRPEVTDVETDAILRRATPSVGFYVGVILLAVFAPQLAVVGYLVVALVAVLRAGGDYSAAEASESA